jgi:hypothetical protein
MDYEDVILAGGARRTVTPPHSVFEPELETESRSVSIQEQDLELEQELEPKPDSDSNEERYIVIPYGARRQIVHSTIYGIAEQQYVKGFKEGLVYGSCSVGLGVGILLFGLIISYRYR